MVWDRWGKVRHLRAVRVFTRPDGKGVTSTVLHNWKAAQESFHVLRKQVRQGRLTRTLGAMCLTEDYLRLCCQREETKNT